MGSKRRMRIRSCKGKKKYLDKQKASEGIARIINKNIKQYGFYQKNSMNFYRCKNCGCYHIGRLKHKTRKMKNK